MSNLFPTFSSYGRYSSSGYGSHCIRISFFGLRVWYSYSTPVAFRGGGFPLTVRKNIWGPTTGKHLNWIDGGDRASRLDSDEFLARLTRAESAVLKNFVSALPDKKKMENFDPMYFVRKLRIRDAV